MKRSSNSAIVCFVLVYAQMRHVSSFNDDDFTKTVFIIRKDKEYLFTESAACVCSDTSEGGILEMRQGREPNRVSLYLCACSGVTEGIIE